MELVETLERPVGGTVACERGLSFADGALRTIVAFGKEVEGPGLVPFGLALEDLPRGGSKVRNRVRGRVFLALGPIERWGGGVGGMSGACRAGGLPARVFGGSGTRFRVTVATTRVGSRVVEDRDQAILDAFGGGKGFAASEIAAGIGVSPRATRTRLARLVGLGLVRGIGSGPQDARGRCFLAARGGA